MLRVLYQSEEVLPLLASEKKSSNEVNVGEQVIAYPIAVIFVLISKFLEALGANGIRTVLALYLRDDLYVSESLATIILHIFNFFSQFCPIFGAILADSYIGNVKSISFFFVLYAFGWIGLFATSFPVPVSVILPVIVSLLFIATGNGSIRACVTSLGALQFRLPEQSDDLAKYFSHYYFAYYAGIFLSKILPPSIRSHTKCFGKSDCYPAVFGTLALIFFTSWMVFLYGKLYYRREYPAQENIVLRVCGCMKHAIRTRLSGVNLNKAHWLDYSVDKYDVQFVEDVKQLIKVAQLFLPLPIYWAMLAQQDSSWTFQATQMNTQILGYRLEPDQAKAMGPIFLFTLIPLWQYLVYPVLNRCGIFIHPLHSVAIGGLCSAFSFIFSGFLQVQIENSPPQTLHIIWQAPQFMMLMLGELFLSIPGLQFAFTQAPASMKSVLTASWFVNNAVGNLIVVAITEFKFVNLQSSEYFIYAIMMFASMIVFTIMACDYIKSRISPTPSDNP
ncbi:unnamed protein product [Hermetia illucens]|uniref:Peptide transporter family 1 n=1 Tax=Hermetia illucens TaxID=343691 RepID=A0A7R8V5Z3_HERIL|nr:peptide transporter family 1 [Hermetia illucens]CAD7093398.1 unnamed protein product [Hermetia illucens]